MISCVLSRTFGQKKILLEIMHEKWDIVFENVLISEKADFILTCVNFWIHNPSAKLLALCAQLYKENEN